MPDEPRDAPGGDQRAVGDRHGNLLRHALDKRFFHPHHAVAPSGQSASHPSQPDGQRTGDDAERLGSPPAALRSPQRGVVAPIIQRPKRETASRRPARQPRTGAPISTAVATWSSGGGRARRTPAPRPDYGPRSAAFHEPLRSAPAARHCPRRLAPGIVKHVCRVAVPAEPGAEKRHGHRGHPQPAGQQHCVHFAAFCIASRSACAR